MEPRKSRVRESSFRRVFTGLLFVLTVVCLVSISGCTGGKQGEDQGNIISNYLKGVSQRAADWLVRQITTVIAYNPCLYDAGTCVGPTGNAASVSAGVHKLLTVMFTILIPFYVTLILINGIYLIWAAESPKNRVQAKDRIMKLLTGMVICACSPAIFQLILDIERGLTVSIMDAGHLKGEAAAAAFALVVITVIVLMLIDFVCELLLGFSLNLMSSVAMAVMSTVVMTLVILGARIVIVTLLGILFPVTIFLYFFDYTKGLGAKLFNVSMLWIFVPVVQAIILVIMFQALNDMQKGSFAGAFLAVGAFALVTVAPMMMTGMMKTIGGSVVHVGKWTQNPRVQLLGWTMMGRGPTALTTMAFDVSMMRSGVQYPGGAENIAKGYYDSAREEGMTKKDAKTAPASEIPYLMGPGKGVGEREIRRWVPDADPEKAQQGKGRWETLSGHAEFAERMKRAIFGRSLPPMVKDEDRKKYETSGQRYRREFDSAKSTGEKIWIATKAVANSLSPVQVMAPIGRSLRHIPPYLFPRGGTLWNATMSLSRFLGGHPTTYVGKDGKERIIWAQGVQDTKQLIRETVRAIGNAPATTGIGVSLGVLAVFNPLGAAGLGAIVASGVAAGYAAKQVGSAMRTPLQNIEHEVGENKRRIEDLRKSGGDPAEIQRLEARNRVLGIDRSIEENNEKINNIREVGGDPKDTQKQTRGLEAQNTVLSRIRSEEAEKERQVRRMTDAERDITSSPAYQRVLASDPDFKKAVDEKGLSGALADPRFEAALRGAGLGSQTDEIKAAQSEFAAHDRNASELRATQKIDEEMEKNRLAIAAGEDPTGKLANRNTLLQGIRDSELEMHRIGGRINSTQADITGSDEYQRVLDANPGFAQAVKEKGFLGALDSTPGFEAALRGEGLGGRIDALNNDRGVFLVHAMQSSELKAQLEESRLRDVVPATKPDGTPNSDGKTPSQMALEAAQGDSELGRLGAERGNLQADREDTQRQLEETSRRIGNMDPENPELRERRDRLVELEGHSDHERQVRENEHEMIGHRGHIQNIRHGQDYGQVDDRYREAREKQEELARLRADPDANRDRIRQLEGEIYGSQHLIDRNQARINLNQDEIDRLKKEQPSSARIAALEAENTRLTTENTALGAAPTKGLLGEARDLERARVDANKTEIERLETDKPAGWEQQRQRLVDENQGITARGRLERDNMRYREGDSNYRQMESNNAEYRRNKERIEELRTRPADPVRDAEIRRLEDRNKQLEGWNQGSRSEAQEKLEQVARNEAEIRRNEIEIRRLEATQPLGGDPAITSQIDTRKSRIDTLREQNEELGREADYLGKRGGGLAERTRDLEGEKIRENSESAKQLNTDNAVTQARLDEIRAMDPIERIGYRREEADLERRMESNQQQITRLAEEGESVVMRRESHQTKEALRDAGPLGEKIVLTRELSELDRKIFDPNTTADQMHDYRQQQETKKGELRTAEAALKTATQHELPTLMAQRETLERHYLDQGRQVAKTEAAIARREEELGIPQLKKQAAEEDKEREPIVKELKKVASPQSDGSWQFDPGKALEHIRKQHDDLGMSTIAEAFAGALDAADGVKSGLSGVQGSDLSGTLGTVRTLELMNAVLNNPGLATPADVGNFVSGMLKPDEQTNLQGLSTHYASTPGFMNMDLGSYFSTLAGEYTGRMTP